MSGGDRDNTGPAPTPDETGRTGEDRRGGDRQDVGLQPDDTTEGRLSGCAITFPVFTQEIRRRPILFSGSVRKPKKDLFEGF